MDVPADGVGIVPSFSKRKRKHWRRRRRMGFAQGVCSCLRLTVNRALSIFNLEDRPSIYSGADVP